MCTHTSYDSINICILKEQRPILRTKKYAPPKQVQSNLYMRIYLKVFKPP